MRQTSINVYHQIESEGLLSKLRFKVYATLFKHGPLTQGELWQEYYPETQRHNVAPRFAELEARGVIKAIGEKPCRVTGRVCTLWEVTNKLPKEPPKQKRHKCRTCKGKGYILNPQLELDL